MTSAEESPLPRFFAPALALGGALLSLWPLPLHPLMPLGHPLGETNNHYWMLWRAGRQLAGAEGPLENLPLGIPIPLMDPVNLPLALPSLWIHPGLGFNQMVLLNLLLAFAGAWALARELGVGPRAALFAGLCAQQAPFLGGVISFGISEALPVGWLGLHASALLAWTRSGQARLAWAAGLSLGAFALSGWYHAFFGLILEPGLLIWAITRRQIPLARAVGGLLAQGGLAVILVVPAFWQFLEVRSFWEERWHAPAPFPARVRPMWRDTPTYGTDLLNLLLPALERVPVSKSVYLGLITLGLGLAGGRGARPLLLLCLPLWVLTLGFWLSIGGQTHVLGRAWRLPAALLSESLPSLQGLSHWHRAAGPATQLLAVAAALGAQRLLAWRPRLAWALLLGVVLESLFLSQTPWPRDTIDPQPPAALLALRERPAPNGGGVVILPFDNGRKEFTDEEPRLLNRWQPLVNLPFAENYEGADALLARNRFIAVVDRLCGVAPTTPSSWRPPQNMQKLAALREPGVLQANIEALAADGVDWVVLSRTRARETKGPTALLREAFGEPVLDLEGMEVYAVPAAGEGTE